MIRHTIYSYANLEDFNRIIDEYDHVYHFKFQETMDALKRFDNLIIDITHLIEYLEFNPQDTYGVSIAFEELNVTHKIIVHTSIAKRALEMLPTIFNQIQNFYPQKSIEEDGDSPAEIEITQRKVLYTYSKDDELNKIFSYTNKNDILFMNFNKADKYKTILNNINKECIIDITSIVYVVRDERRYVLLVEQLFESVEKAVFIIEENHLKDALEIFRFNFEKSELIHLKFPDLKNEETTLEQANTVKNITDLTNHQLQIFFEELNRNLIGHDFFKEKFSELIKNFTFLNKFNEQKILSTFLYGSAGVGKTEVARIIQKALNPNENLIKINFGNYSSQDALNSLIGSPAGYIGYENGELSRKVEKYKTGLILCDEFEKATPQVFNFFLELLEDGKFTDSMNREFDLNGYIIIFTSNIRNKNEFISVIPNEFKSRLDLVSEFEPLDLVQKKEYVRFQVDHYIDKFIGDTVKEQLDDLQLKEFSNVNLSNHDLREIKENIKAKFVDYLSKHEHEDLIKDTNKH